MMPRLDLTGQRFERLVVDSMTWRDGEGYAHCRCDCGVTHTVRSSCLRRGTARSCGCWRKEWQENHSKSLRLDLTDQRFGSLVVQSMAWRNGKGYAICRCDCGTIKTIHGNVLRRGESHSCGCLRQAPCPERKDLTGHRFGRLVVVSMVWRGRRGVTLAQCQCDCGIIVTKRRDDLLSGDTQSCGCIRFRTAEEKRIVGRRAEQKYRARKRGLPEHFDNTHALFMQQFWGHCCAVCGAVEDFWRIIAFDHWVPLAHMACPGTVPENMLPLCHARKGAGPLVGPPACNNAKGKKEPIAWLMERLGPRKGQAQLRVITRYFTEVLTREEYRRALPDKPPVAVLDALVSDAVEACGAPVASDSPLGRLPHGLQEGDEEV